jgi:hypothetical protein
MKLLITVTLEANSEEMRVVAGNRRFDDQFAKDNCRFFVAQALLDDSLLRRGLCRVASRGSAFSAAVGGKW